MADKIEIKQTTDVVATVTGVTSSKSAVEAVATEVIQKTETRATRPSLSPSRSSMSTFFRLSKTFSKVVAPEYADDDNNDDDDDDDSDDTNDDDDDNDSEPDEMQDGDEPMTDAEQNQTASGQQGQNQSSSAEHSVASAFSNVNPFLHQVKDPRDPSFGRMKFVPEPVQPEDGPNSRAASPEPKAPIRSLPTTPEEDLITPAAAKSTADPPATTSSERPAAPRTVSAPARPRATSGTSKPSSPPPENRFSAASTVRNSTASLPASPALSRAQSSTSVGEKSTTSTTPKVDPLAPTAAAPYGYKIVTVKKPDGTVAKVKRPLKEGEKAPTPAPKPRPTVTKSVSQTSTQKSIAIGSIDASIAPIATEKPGIASVAKAPEPTSTVTVKEVTAEPTSERQSIPSRGPMISEKQSVDPSRVQVTEKELERVTSPRPVSMAGGELPEDEFRKARRAAMAFKIIVWAVGILLPLFFLALAVVTALKDHKKLPYKYDPEANPDLGGNAANAASTFSVTSLTSVFSKPGTTVKPDPLSQAIKVAASAWPIVFAAVIAQTLKMYAAHKVERGIKLMQLEQLISSHSVGSALKQPFMLRTFNWTTIGLFFIWCLSPLAGQAILRMVTTEATYDIMNSNVTYFSSETLSQYARDNGPWAYKGGYRTDVPNSWFESSLLTALLQGYTQTQNLTQDIYRNLRIPYYRDPAASDSDQDAGWPYTYSSLVGYPFWINATCPKPGQCDTSNEALVNNTDQETQFSIITSYFSFNCSNFTVIDAYGSIMQSHNLLYSKNRTLAITAENNTKSIYTQLPWYPPAPPNSSNLFSNESQVVPNSVLNATSTRLPTSTMNATSTVISPTAKVNETTSIVIPTTTTANGTILVSQTTVPTTIVTPTNVVNGTLVANSTQTLEQKDVQSTSTAGGAIATQTSSSGTELYYREPGPNGTLYYTTNKDGESVYFSTCAYETVVVNTTFYCQNVAQWATTCYPVSQQRLRDREPYGMPLGYWFPTILQNLGSINPNPGNYSQMEQFIVNPYFGASLNLSDTDPKLFDAGPVSGANLSQRLQLVANTVWALGLNEGAFMGPNEQTWFNEVKPGYTNATATGYRYTVYVVSWPWLAALIVCSVLLTIAAVSAAIWETRVVGPDFLGFANTAMKKNVKMPKNLSSMNARDRLLALQEVEVILQDTRPHKDVGRIALGVKDEESARLVHGRQYR